MGKNQIGRERLLYLQLRSRLDTKQRLSRGNNYMTVRQVKRKLEYSEMLRLEDGVIYKDSMLKYYKQGKELFLKFRSNVYNEEKAKLGLSCDKEVFDKWLNKDETILDTVSIPRDVFEYVPKVEEKPKSKMKIFVRRH